MLRSWNRNRLTAKLGIDHPIIQGPLGGLPSKRLTAAVSDLADSDRSEHTAWRLNDQRCDRKRWQADRIFGLCGSGRGSGVGQATARLLVGKIATITQREGRCERRCMGSQKRS